jgi:hypothetical protein
MKRAWHSTIKATGVRKIRPYDLRHTFASLLITAGKNPLYIARQMGHYSAGFTLDTYGHLMEALPKRQVEWIDELVFPEGWDVATQNASMKRPCPSSPSSSASCVVIWYFCDPRSCIYPCRLRHTVYCELGLPITWRVLNGTMQFGGSPEHLASSAHDGAASRSS